MKYFISRIKPAFLNPLHKPSDTIIVAGSGRSGTTWLGDIIGSGPGFLSLFEPFDHRHVPDIDTSLLRLYIRATTKAHYLDDTIGKVLQGEIKNEWILSQNKRTLAWRILIKEIRMNLFLGYLKNRFGNKIVFIIRHPCATVLSRLEQNWSTHLDHFLIQEDLMNDYLYPFENLINESKNDLEKHTIMWCVENLIPLKQLGIKQLIFCTYENLVINGIEEIHKIFKRVGLKFRNDIHRIFSKPSKLSNPQKARVYDFNRLTYWKEKLYKNEIASILKIAEHFEIDIYTDDAMPNMECSILK